MECRYFLKPRVIFSLKSPSRINPSAEEGVSAPSAEVIGECRVHAVQEHEVAELSELYTYATLEANHIFLEYLSLAKGCCSQTQWKLSTTPPRSKRHHGTIRSCMLILRESMA